MSRLSRGTRVAVFLRSLAVQGSWNYRTLLGAGFAFALIPALRRVYADDEPSRLQAAVQQHCALFNSHPYLAPVALGAVARLEAEGADPVLIDRFKTALRGALGGLGDRLVWAGWRPACVLLGLAVWMAGSAAWVAALVFLSVYNIGHLALRVWAFHVGLRDGVQVASRLRGSRVGRAQHLLGTAGAFLLGVAIPLAASGRLVETAAAPASFGLALVAGGIGVAVGARLRVVVTAALVVAAVAAAAVAVVGGWSA